MSDLEQVDGRALRKAYMEGESMAAMAKAQGVRVDTVRAALSRMAGDGSLGAGMRDTRRRVMRAKRRAAATATAGGTVVEVDGVRQTLRQMYMQGDPWPDMAARVGVKGAAEVRAILREMNEGGDLGEGAQAIRRAALRRRQRHGGSKVRKVKAEARPAMTAARIHGSIVAHRKALQGRMDKLQVERDRLMQRIAAIDNERGDLSVEDGKLDRAMRAFDNGSR